MFGPAWEQGCPSCSYLADHFGGSLVHLANRDVTLAVVSRAPIAQIEAFKQRMGWQFRWVSSFANDLLARLAPARRVPRVPLLRRGDRRV